MRKVLEDLIFAGKLEETYKVSGVDFTLATLTSKERLDATSETITNDALSRITALKIALLGRALKKVNNEKIVDEAEGLEFIGSLQAPLIDALFTRYEALQAKQEDALADEDEVKN